MEIIDTLTEGNHKREIIEIDNDIVINIFYTNNVATKYKVFVDKGNDKYELITTFNVFI